MNLWRKLRMLCGGGTRAQGSREQMMQAFRAKYSNFKTLLESNTELLKIISDIELKLRGQSIFGASYIEAQTMRAVFHSARMVMCLENMAGRPYPALQKSLQEIHRRIKMEDAERPAEVADSPDLIMAYDRVGRHSAPLVGAKNANIGEIRNRLQMHTPNGFALTTAAYRRFMEANDLNDTIMRLKSKADLIEDAVPPGCEVTVDAYNGRVYAGRVPELIESGAQLTPALRSSPAYQALRRRADLIVPLNLTDPKSTRFAPEFCRTIHDIMRFIHERSYEEIFQLGDLVTDRGRLSVCLRADIPIDLYIIDLGGGLSVDATQVATVTVPQIRSAPLSALIDGMLNEKLQSRGPRPIQLGGLVSVMTRQWLSPPNMGAERFGDRSYAIISDRYLNFSSRVGYHYSILDCYCGRTSAKNHINFQFKGGAADPVRRNRRARVIEKVLAESGFSLNTVADRVDARLAKQPAEIIKERLDLIGRLLIYTRQMDMLMHSELLVDKLAECFLNGNYTLEPEADRTSCES